VDPSTLDLKTLRGFSDVFDNDVSQVWDFRTAVEKKSSRGGVASKAIAEQIDHARKAVTED
jgi:argininosuccinate lyase